MTQSVQKILLSWWPQGFNLDAVLDRYSDFGPLTGILLPLLEALLPFLPLAVFVVANANAFGFWLGFLYSWIGVCLGASAVFGLARGLGGRLGQRLRERHAQAEKFIGWLERRGFTTVFVLSCFPFTPSVLVNVAAGMTRMPFPVFFAAIFFGKAVMIFTMTAVGYDLRGLVENPVRLALSAAVLIAVLLIGKKVEKLFAK